MRCAFPNSPLSIYTMNMPLLDSKWRLVGGPQQHRLFVLRIRPKQSSPDAAAFAYVLVEREEQVQRIQNVTCEASLRLRYRPIFADDTFSPCAGHNGVFGGAFIGGRGDGD